MAKKTLDIDKIKEAIKTLEEARELLAGIEEVLPERQQSVPISPWRYWPVYPYHEPQPSKWWGTYTQPTSDNYTIRYDSATSNIAYN